MDVFYFGSMVDQVNCPGLVCFESASRRLLSIIDAYRDPHRINWNAARFYTGSTGLDDAAPTEMRAFVTRSVKDFNDVEAMRTRTSQAGGGDDSAAAAAGGDGGGDGKRPQRRGGRGQRTRAPAPADG